VLKCFFRKNQDRKWTPISMLQTKIKRSKLQIFLLCLGHFINDMHLSFLPTFIPGIVERLGISLTQAGLLNSIAGLINMMGQPLFGHLSDKTNKPVFIIAGPVLACFYYDYNYDNNTRRPSGIGRRLAVAVELFWPGPFSGSGLFFWTIQGSTKLRRCVEWRSR